MNLTETEIKTFYKIWYSLVWGINEKHRVIPTFTKPKYGTRVSVSVEEFVEVRNAMWKNPKWIDEFLLENDNGEFSEEERSIIAKWGKQFVKDDFLVTKHVSKYTVLMSIGSEPAYLYGVHGISDPLEMSLPLSVPFIVNLVLLPWGDKIIYDSLVESSNISLGPGLRSAAKEWYNTSKKKYGIIETLGTENSNEQVSEIEQREPIAKAGVRNDNIPTGVKIPKNMTEKYNEIAEIIIQFSDEKLNDEYKELALKALAKLCRKRPSPLLKGKAGTWACGIVYAIGSSNFIFDKSQEINMTAVEIAAWFGLSKSTAGSKSSEISKLLKISFMNAEYLLKSVIDANSAIWLVSIDGYIVDVRNAPYEFQQEAYERGFIPYIPDDKE